jgi:hypothetical protein
MAKYKTIVALANRTGGKTYDFAILNLLDLMANDNCEAANLAAILPQATRCYRYMQKFIGLSQDFTNFLEKDPTMSRSLFKNKSVMEILVATMSGVNSPHPQKVKIDEIDLIPWPILQQAFSMVQTKEGVKGVMVLGSTRKFAQGPMQRLIDQGSAKVYQWCIWEVVEALPNDRTLIEQVVNTFGDKLPARIAETSGYYKWEDVIDTFQRLDLDVWETEWECQRPNSQGLIYPRFDDILNNEPNFKIDKEWRQIYIFEDFGYAKDHPDVVLFAQVDVEKQEVIIFDELYNHLTGTDDIIQGVKDKLMEHGLNLFDISGWIGDPHGLTEQQDRYNKGMPMLEKVDDPPLYLLKNRLPHVRKFIDDRRLRLVLENCPNLRQELLSYSKKRLPNGFFSDIAMKENDHGPDALGYGLVRLFPQLAYGSFMADGKYSSPETAGHTYDEFDSVPAITTGLLGKTF